MILSWASTHDVRFLNLMKSKMKAKNLHLPKKTNPEKVHKTVAKRQVTVNIYSFDPLFLQIKYKL